MYKNVIRSNGLAQARQAQGEKCCFKIGIEWLFCTKGRFNLAKLGIMKTGMALRVRLAAFMCALDKGHDIIESSTENHTQSEITGKKVFLESNRLINCPERLTIGGLSGGIGINPALKRCILFGASGNDIARLQGSLRAGIGFQSVLNAKQCIFGLFGMIGAFTPILPQHPLSHRIEPNNCRIDHVTLKRQGRSRKAALGASRITRGKDQIASLGARRIKLEERRMNGLAIFVHTQHRQIDVIARIIEIIRIAAKKCDALLRRHHDTNILVAPVTVKCRLPAVIERHHIATPMGIIPADAVFGQFAFNLLKAEA